jgi:hypothetical protein
VEFSRSDEGTTADGRRPCGCAGGFVELLEVVRGDGGGENGPDPEGDVEGEGVIQRACAN